MNSYTELEKFSKMMQTPIITSLRNSQNYVSAANTALSIFEMANRRVTTDKEQWKPLTYWAEGRLLKKKETANGQRKRESALIVKLYRIALMIENNH